MIKEEINPQLYAMSYEHLLRTAYQCGRSEIPGVDADVYRRLLRAETNFRLNSGTKNSSDLQYELNVQLRTVAGNINAGLMNVLGNNFRVVSDEQRTSLEEIRSSLEDVDIKRLCELMDQTLPILKEIGLKPG